jgi:hypothetical protein
VAGITGQWGCNAQPGYWKSDGTMTIVNETYPIPRNTNEYTVIQYIEYNKNAYSRHIKIQAINNCSILRWAVDAPNGNGIFLYDNNQITGISNDFIGNRIIQGSQKVKFINMVNHVSQQRYGAMLYSLLGRKVSQTPLTKESINSSANNVYILR